MIKNTLRYNCISKSKLFPLLTIDEVLRVVSIRGSIILSLFQSYSLLKGFRSITWTVVFAHCRGNGRSPAWGQGVEGSSQCQIWMNYLVSACQASSITLGCEFNVEVAPLVLMRHWLSGMSPCTQCYIIWHGYGPLYNDCNIWTFRMIFA